MAKSESDSNDKPLDSLAQLKEQVSGFNKSSLKELLFSLIDEYESVNTENCMLKDVCSYLKKMLGGLNMQMRSSNVKDLKWI